MDKEKIAEELDKVNNTLNGIIGRLTVHRNIPEVKEAHEMAIGAGVILDDVLNELT